MFHVEHSSFGVYIHVPFCVSKCGYCDFCRVTDLSLVEGYLGVLENEISQSEIAGCGPATIYIGGGTPSCLGKDGVDRLLRIVNKYLKTDEVSEWTVECNPDDVDNDLALTLTAHGVNRVSMGAQSLYDPMLKMMGRRHNAEQVAHTIECLRKAGIDNISVDCIFGLPVVKGKTDGYDVKSDFKKFINLGVEHLSAYALQYEEGSAFSKLISEGKMSALPDDVVADQYALLKEMMRKAGYVHYEISNYSKPGCEAKHNSSYWDRTPYYGFGPAASSLVGLVRATNTYDVKEYIASVGKKKELVERLTAKDVYDEVVMLGLRTNSGVNENNVPEPYRKYYEMAVEREVRNGNLVRLGDGNVRIPEDKWFVSDGIIERMFC